jgi:hypothetical protein
MSQVKRSWRSAANPAVPSACSVLVRTSSSSVTMVRASNTSGVIRPSVDFCCTEFGLWVDRHGDPSRSPTASTVEWEGTAERAAHHHPYVLLFDSRFIEIRNVETGRLAQIIPGNDIRCIWDGRGARMPPTQTAGQDGWGADSGVDQEARVHAVMNAPEQPSQDGRRVARSAVQSQQVVELIPTIPLYLPGALSRYAFVSRSSNRRTNMPFSPARVPPRTSRKATRPHKVREPPCLRPHLGDECD